MAQMQNAFVICLMILVSYIGLEAVRAQRNTQLVFYLHDIVQTANATTVLVAGPNGDTKTLSSFGSVMVIDDALTEGPERLSELVGRAQGIYITDSLNYLSLLLTFTAVFEEDKYNGTLSFHGADRISLPTREISVVGGTGHFRFAKGYASIETVSLVGLSAVLKFDCTVHH